jgi:hypothetical protein
MVSRILIGLCLLACTLVSVAPVQAAGNSAHVFDAINAFELSAWLPPSSVSTRRGFIVTGILRGSNAEQSLTYQFPDETMTNQGIASCERFALMVMKHPGEYALAITLQGSPSLGILGCRLERR